MNIEEAVEYFESLTEMTVDGKLPEDVSLRAAVIFHEVCRDFGFEEAFGPLWATLTNTGMDVLFSIHPYVERMAVVGASSPESPKRLPADFDCSWEAVEARRSPGL